MDVFEAIKQRKSVRSYRRNPVPHETLTKVLEAARLAPSADNIQPWNFIVAKDSQVRSELAKLCPWGKFLSRAPVVIVGCGDPTSPFYVHDVCIALEHIVLAATAVGLGTCWIGGFDEEGVKELLGIPNELRVVALISVGYPRRSRRKKLDKIAHSEKFGNPWKTT